MVYLVDDDVEDLEIVQEALVMNSYKGPVITASNGKVLMDRLKEMNKLNQPDVIILDLNMPLKNGFEALHEIRTSPALQNIPVIILTASPSKQDQLRCFELGCNLFFTKPNTIDEYAELVNTVKMLISRSF